MTDTRARTTSWTALVLGLLFSGLAVLHLRNEPPCPENYVRFLDPAPVLPYLAGCLVLLGAVPLSCAVREGTHDTARRFAVALAVLAGLGCVGTLALMSGDGASYSSHCFTF
jgi:hypothetical protein